MYYFYLDRVLLPQAPSKMLLKIKGKDKVYDLLSGGETIIMNPPGLTDIEFTVTVSQRTYQYLLPEAGRYGAAYYLKHFKKLKMSGAPFRLVVYRKHPTKRRGVLELFHTNMLVRLMDYQIDEDAGKNGTDIEVPLKLKQVPGNLTAPVAVVEGKRITRLYTPRAIERARASSYAPKAGEDMWDVAKKLTGDGSRYKEVAKANPPSPSGRYRPVRGTPYKSPDAVKKDPNAFGDGGAAGKNYSIYRGGYNTSPGGGAGSFGGGSGGGTRRRGGSR